MTRGAIIATLCALVLATGAAASTAETGRQQIRLNAADNAAARAIVLRQSDFGNVPGWSGGVKKPDLSSPGPTCANFHPKNSDLVITGVAKSQFQNAGVLVDSEAQVLRTAKMVKLDWQRSVLAPGLLSCLRSYLGKSAPANARVHAIQKLAFPRVAQYTAAFRLAIEVTAQGTTLRMVLDFLLVGKGRTEVTLTTVAPYEASGAIKSAEVRLARLLASRIRA